MTDNILRNHCHQGLIHFVLIFMLTALIQVVDGKELIQLDRVLKLSWKGPNSTVALLGNGFKSKCRRCEVIIEYKRGLRISADIQSWSNQRIVINVPDINSSTTVKLRVQLAKRKSNSLKFSIKRRFNHGKNAFRSANIQQTNNRSNKKSVVHNIKSNTKIGAKGEYRIDVSNAAPVCGKNTEVFDHANIKIQKNRFGQAQFTSIPNPGCTTCKKLVVRWYHEPTGHIDFQVQVSRRVVTGVCLLQKR